MPNFNPLKPLCLALLLLFNIPVFAQYDTPLANDPNVRIGTLGNGFTYYVRKNTETKGRAILYLATKVGSILEDDNQQGLAHFIEHMGFDGTKHYPKNELINYLQKAGVRFGADLNAYTSFDETVYQLPIPTDDPEILSNGIQIIRDWAQDATLDPADIEKERGMVLEEKRYRSGVRERMNREIYPIIYNNSRYGKRLPIGTDEVLNNAKPETLIKFYHDWYRPDLQAIIAVGDFDVNQMLETIVAKFGGLKNPDNEKKRTEYHIQLVDDHQYVAVTDKEYHGIYSQILVKDKDIVLKTEGDYFGYMLRTVFNICMQNRFKDLSATPNPYFTKAAAGAIAYPGGISVYSSSVNTTPENIESGLKTIWRENIRAASYGFTPDEYAKATNIFYGSKYYAAHQPDKTTSQTYVNQYLYSFLRGGIVPGEALELKLTQYFLQKMNLNLVNRYCNALLSSGNRDVVIQAAEMYKDKLPDMQTVEGWLSDVSKENITNTVLTVAPKVKTQALITKKPEKSKVSSQKTIESIDVTEVILSNGVKIALKPNHTTQYAVRFNSVALGGWDPFNTRERLAGINAAPLILASGVGDLDQQQLIQFIANNFVTVTPYLNRYTQGVSGSCTIKNLEAALQLCNQYFTRPREDTAAFNVYLKKLKDTPNPLILLEGISARLHEKVDYDRAYSIYKERFANAADFSFVFIGDFEVKQVLPLLERYLGSLPSDPQKTYVPVAKTTTPTSTKPSTTYAGLEAKATVNLQYTGSYTFNYETNTQFNALAEVLRIRLLERLRMQDSGTYGASVRLTATNIPDGHFTLTINFVCDPANVEKLITDAVDEVEQCKTAGPLQLNIDKYKAAEKRVMDTQLKTNAFWASYLYDQYLNKQPLEDIAHHQDAVDKVTPETVKHMASTYLTTDNYRRRVTLPLSAKK